MNLKLKTIPLRFDEKEHVYYLNGERVAGVSKIVNERSKDFLKFWTVKEMYLFLMAEWDPSKIYTENEKLDLLERGKKAHVRKANEGKTIGSETHKLIEKYLKEKNTPVSDNPKVMQCIKSFLEWEKKYKPEWILSEFQVASSVHKFAGTLDALAILDGKLSIIDFKTNSHISETWFLQTAGYQIALEEMIVEQIPLEWQRVFVRIPKDGTEADHIVAPTPIQFDKQTFLNFRDAHKWNFWVDKYLKDERGFLSLEKIKGRTLQK